MISNNLIAVKNLWNIGLHKSMIVCVFSIQNYRCLKQAVTNMRVTLQCFKSLTYNVNNTTIGVDVVERINTKLQTLLNELQDKLPQGHGLLIRPQLRKDVLRSYRLRLMSKQLNLLPKCTMKKKRFNEKLRGIVGRKLVNVCRNVKIYVTISAKRGLIAFPSLMSHNLSCV